jgi:hypothetical protein
MTDYIVQYKYTIDDIEIKNDKMFTIEDDIYIKPNKRDREQDIEFEIDQIIESILFEKLKDYFECENIELIGFEPVNKECNLFKFTKEDVYYDDEYTYKGDIKNMIKEFIGKDTKEGLDLISKIKTK